MLSGLGHSAVMQVTFAAAFFKLVLRCCGHFVGPPGESSSLVDHHRSSLCRLFIVNIITAICPYHSRIFADEGCSFGLCLDGETCC